MVTIFAAKLNKVGVFLLGSLLMIILQIFAVIIGQIFPFILNQSVTQIIAVALFYLFGVYMVIQAFTKQDSVVSKLKDLN